MADRPTGSPEPETPELRRLRKRIDALDGRIVGLVSERAELAREVGRAKAADGRRAIRDPEREREVLLRVSMANPGPIPQAELLAVYRRLMAAMRRVEADDRDATRRGRSGPPGGPAPADRSPRPDPNAPTGG